MRIAETALLEWGAQCVRKWRSGDYSRGEARARFFGRAKKMSPYLDQQTPIAIDGGSLVNRIVATADGLPSPEEAASRERDHANGWHSIVLHIEMTDEAFCEEGEKANSFLSELDKEFIGLARPEAELRQKPISPEFTAEGHAAAQAEWDALNHAAREVAVANYIRRSTRLTDAAAERLHGYVSSLARRMYEAARGSRSPKENDGADLGLLKHVGAGCVLVTNETHLVRILDESGSFQRPWVRRTEDLEDLPDEVPWGSAARRFGETFRRRERPSSR